MEIPASSFLHQHLDTRGRYPANFEAFNPDPGYRGTTGTEFEGFTLDEVKSFLKENCFIYARQLPDGSWSGLYPLAFTLSVCCAISEYNPYQYRWCFSNPEDAKKFIEEMETFDQVPTNRESLIGHRYTNSARLLSTDELGFRKW